MLQELKEHLDIRNGWSILWGGPSSEDLILEHVEQHLKPNHMIDYLSLIPKGGTQSRIHTLSVDDQTLLENLYNTLRACIGRTKREIGLLKVKSDLTIA
jgi:hypothetical protein